MAVAPNQAHLKPRPTRALETVWYVLDPAHRDFDRRGITLLRCHLETHLHIWRMKLVGEAETI